MRSITSVVTSSGNGVVGGGTGTVILVAVLTGTDGAVVDGGEALVPELIVVPGVCWTAVIELDAPVLDVVETRFSPQDTAMASNTTTARAGLANFTNGLNAGQADHHQGRTTVTSGTTLKGRRPRRPPTQNDRPAVDRRSQSPASRRPQNDPRGQPLRSALRSIRGRAGDWESTQPACAAPIDVDGSLADVEPMQHDEAVFVLAILGALLVGGVIGAGLNRWRPTNSRPPTKRLEDSDNVDVQAGFRNMHGPQT